MKKLILAFLFVCCAGHAETTAIVNSAIRTGRITREDARALYLMKERRWDNGQLVIIFQMPLNSRQHRAFVRDVLGMSNEQYLREWGRIVNAGLNTYIRPVATYQEMLTRVSNTPSSLGYIDADNMFINAGEQNVTFLHITD